MSTTAKQPANWGAITFTAESWRKLKARYKLAVKNNEKAFVFDGHDFVTDFAKYFIEYHDQKFK